MADVNECGIVPGCNFAVDGVAELRPRAETLVRFSRDRPHAADGDLVERLPIECARDHLVPREGLPCDRFAADTKRPKLLNLTADDADWKSIRAISDIRG